MKQILTLFFIALLLGGCATGGMVGRDGNASAGSMCIPAPWDENCHKQNGGTVSVETPQNGGTVSVETPNCGFWANLFGRCEKFQNAKRENLATKEAQKKAEAETKRVKVQPTKRVNNQVRPTKRVNSQVRPTKRNSQVQLKRVQPKRVTRLEEKRIHRQNVTTIERYPTIECRDQVKAEQKFAVQISLTEDLITSGVITEPNRLTTDTTVTKEGRVALSLSDAQDRWEIEVILSAPAFTIHGSEIKKIILPRYGDSDVALFHLAPKPIQKRKQVQKLRATLWHQGTYLARIVREITVVDESKASIDIPKWTSDNPATGITFQATFVPNTPIPIKEYGKTNVLDIPISREEYGKTKQTFNLGLQSPDMTIYLEHHFLPNRSMITIHSNVLNRFKGSFSQSQEMLSQWLNRYYGDFTRASQNITTLASYGQSTNLEKKRNIDRLRGFGRRLYNQYAPPEFKKAFWALKDKLGDDFDTIQIFTDDPLIPWELMIPSRNNKELDFLGIDFQIARWHLSENSKQLDRPPQLLNLQQLLAIIPEYPDDDLAAVSNELEVLQQITGFHRVAGHYDAVSQLFQDAVTENSMIHFSGHGIAQKITSNLARYAIKLEDGKLDLMTWRGLIPHYSQTHPFFFFNACDIGQAHQVANFVDGWAPAVLETGASGYIGGLWSLVNIGATEFAEWFYQQLEKGLTAGQAVNVADLLRKTRKRFYDNGDPTFLGYVYYGDPHFQLVRE